MRSVLRAQRTLLLHREPDFHRVHNLESYAMNMREQFEARFPVPADVRWDERGQYYVNNKTSVFAYQAIWTGWQAAQSTTCPGHGRSECVSCCWPKGEGSGVELGRQLVEQVLSVMPENYAGHSFGVTAPDGSTLGDVIITVVKPDGKGPHDLRVEAESRVTELANLLTLAKAYVPVTDPLRGLINANLMQPRIEHGPKS